MATVSLSCARSITASVRPPRAAFLDWPLGRTAGRPHEPVLQRRIVLGALSLAASARRPGVIEPLDEPWPDGDGWKDAVLRPGSPDGSSGGDTRVPRSAEPQWQLDEDRVAWESGGESTGAAAG